MPTAFQRNAHSFGFRCLLIRFGGLTRFVVQKLSKLSKLRPPFFEYHIRFKISGNPHNNLLNNILIDYFSIFKATILQIFPHFDGHTRPSTTSQPTPSHILPTCSRQNVHERHSQKAKKEWKNPKKQHQLTDNQ